MKQDDFLGLVKHFSKQPTVATEGRHIYLWHGDLRKLQSVIPSNVLINLDIHRLATGAKRSPRAKDEAQRLLSKLIKDDLSESVIDSRQQIIIVTGCDLLSRYSVPLTNFYENVSEIVMVIFVVSPTETKLNPNVVLPDYVTFDPTITLAYLKNIVGESAVIDTTEDQI
jgi:hypothetical protein